MFQLKRFAPLLFVLSLCAGDAPGQSWMNDLLVHRTPSFTGDGADSCLVCHSGEKMRAVGRALRSSKMPVELL